MTAADHHGQGAVATGNAATYNVNAQVDLPAGNNLRTKLGRARQRRQ
jgi:hypothetical protein